MKSLPTLVYAPRDTKRDAAKRKRAKRRERTDPGYLDWIREQPCIVGRGCFGRIGAHHEPPVSHAGQWHDHSTAPLCVLHHAERHSVLALDGFQARYELSIAARILELRGKYLTEIAG